MKKINFAVIFAFAVALGTNLLVWLFYAGGSLNPVKYLLLDAVVTALMAFFYFYFTDETGTSLRAYKGREDK